MESLMAVVFEWSITLLVLLLYLFIRCVLLIVRVCVRHWSTPVWISLIVFGVCLLISVLLVRISPGVSSLPTLGFVQLAAVCKVVEVQNADLLLKEPETPIQAVMHSNWFQLHP